MLASILVVFGGLLFLTPLLPSYLVHFSVLYDQSMWTMAVILTAAITLLIYWLISPKDLPVWRWHWLDGLILGWWLWLIVTTILSYDPISSLMGPMDRNGALLHWTGMITLYYLVRWLVPRTPDNFWQYLQSGIALAGTAIATVGLLKLGLGTQAGRELLGLLGNQTFTAYYLGVTLLTTFLLWLRQPKTFNWWALALAVQAAALWFTYARWVYLVIGVMVMLIGWWTTSRWDTARPKRWWLAGAFGLVVLALLTNFAFQRSTYFRWGDTTITHRLTAWDIGWEASQERPILGWGLENYYRAWQANFRPEFEDVTGATETFDNPHNLFISHLVATGWVGLLVFLAMLWLALAKGFRRSIEPDTLWAASIVVAYIGLDLWAFETIITTTVFVLALAYLGGATPRLRWRWHVSATVSRWLAGVGALALAIGLFGLVAAPWFGFQVAWRAAARQDLSGFDRVLALAPYLKPELMYYLIVSPDTPLPTTAPPLYSKIAAYMELNIGHLKTHPGYYLALANAWQASDNTDKLSRMKSALVRALDITHNNNGYYWAYLAQIEVQLGNTDEALADIAKAKLLNPGSRFTELAEEKINEWLTGQSTQPVDEAA